jgi:Spy/CpxP family protein refolding chaperone
MKKYVFIFVAAMMMGIPTAMNAQDNNQSTTTDVKANRPHLTDEQIVQKRTESMSRELMLDDETNAKFVPVYSQYLKDLMSCRPKRPEMGKRDGQQPQAEQKTDAEIEKMIQDRFEQSQKILDIRKSYYSKFRKILTPKQILKIYDSERDNMGKFKKEMNKRRDGQQGFNGRQGFNGNRGFNGNHGFNGQPKTDSTATQN